MPSTWMKNVCLRLSRITCLFYSIPTYTTHAYYTHFTTLLLFDNISTSFFLRFLSLSISMDVERKSSHLLIQFCFDGIFHIALLLLHSTLVAREVKMRLNLKAMLFAPIRIQVMIDRSS